MKKTLNQILMDEARQTELHEWMKTVHTGHNTKCGMSRMCGELHETAYTSVIDGCWMI